VPLEQRQVGLHQRLRDVDAGVVDQAVQPSQGFGGGNGAGPVLGPRHVLADEGRGGAKLRGQSCAFGLAHIAQHHLGALGHQHPGFRRALATRTP
jgi:hypothetical protein